MAKIRVFFLFLIIVITLLFSACTVETTVTNTVTQTIPETKTTTISNTTTLMETTTETSVTTITVITTTTSQIPQTTTTTTPPMTTTTTTQESTPTKVSYTLGEAITLDLIAVEINGSAGLSFGGVSSGDIIVISFLRQAPETMKIIVPLGTTLVCNDSTKQNMVIFKLKGRDPSVLGYYPVDDIILSKDEWQEFLFEAYCLDINKGNIQNSTTFSIGELASQEIITMLSAADELGPEKATINGIQVALWVLTDDPSLEELLNRYDADDETIASAWAILDTAGLNPGLKKIFEGYTPT